MVPALLVNVTNSGSCLMRRLIFILFFFSPLSYAESWTGSGFAALVAGNPYSSFSGCWSVLMGGFNNPGCSEVGPFNVPTVSGVSIRMRSYANSGCTSFVNYSCTFSRDGGACPSLSGSGHFPIADALPACSGGGYACYTPGSEHCGSQPGDLANCKVTIAEPGEGGGPPTVVIPGTESGEFGAEGCNTAPDTAIPCQDDEGNSLECAAACSPNDYTGEGCPENQCNSDPEGLGCLTQCNFHDFENCPEFGSSSSSSTSTSTSTSSGGGSSGSPIFPPSPSPGSSGGGPGGGGGTDGDGAGPGTPSEPTFPDDHEDFAGVDFAPLIDFMKDFFRGPDIQDPIEEDHYADVLDPETFGDVDDALTDGVTGHINTLEDGLSESWLTDIFPAGSACQSYVVEIPDFTLSGHTLWSDVNVDFPGTQFCAFIDEKLKPFFAFFLYLMTALYVFRTFVNLNLG